MHPRYLEQVLRDRGIPHPPIRQLEAFIGQLSEAELPVMEERLRKLALGAEQQEDLDALLQGINAARQEPAQLLEMEAPSARKAGTKSTPRHAVDGEKVRPQRVPPTEEKLPAEVLATLRQHGMHVYASSAALKIELATLRAGEASGALQYTVQIDGAKAKGNGYDWIRKVPFQFTRRELPVLAAFLLGMGGKKLAFANHGPNTDKHLEIEDQGAHLFVKMRVSGGPVVALPVPPADVFGWGELCLVGLQMNRPAIGTDGHLALLRRIGRMGDARD